MSEWQQIEIEIEAEKRKEIEAGIAAISEALKRPLSSHAERLMLHAEHKELRAILSSLPPPPKDEGKS